MAKQKRKQIEELLFQVYDKGLQMEECNLTDYYEKIKQALNIPLVSVSKPTIREKNNLPEDVRYLFNKGVKLYQCILNYESSIITKEEFIKDMREAEAAYSHNGRV